MRGEVAIAWVIEHVGDDTVITVSAEGPSKALGCEQLLASQAIIEGDQFTRICQFSSGCPPICSCRSYVHRKPVRQMLEER